MHTTSRPSSSSKASSHHRPRRSGLVVAAAVAAAAGIGMAPAAHATSVEGQLPALVRTDDIMAHMANLQTIADFNGGNRAHGTDGYEISAKYVIDQLERAGYAPTKHHYEFERWLEHSPPELATTRPEEREFALDEDFLTMRYSGAGDVTAPGVAVNPDSDASGCSAGDFADFPDGAVAIVKRGTCTFERKATLATDAGAAAIVIFNHGNDDQSLGPVNGTAGTMQEIPVLGASLQAGKELVEAATATPTANAAGVANADSRVRGEGLRTPELEMRVRVDAELVEDSSYNIIAETERGAEDNVVVVGAHLDSAEAGPGINDNASGTAAILEVAKQLPKLDTVDNKVRFAFWGTEELGLIGSTRYVESLSEAEMADIALYLNFDMVGSPNYARFIYDGRDDLDAAPAPPPAGSGAIQRMFENYFDAQGLKAEPTEFSGRSDYAAFMEAGIASGGLFSGGDGVKTAEQVEHYGGTAGEMFDPNYHTAEDDIDNVNEDSVRELSGGIAHAVETYADSTLPVNGVLRTMRTEQDLEFDRKADLWVR